MSGGVSYAAAVSTPNGTLRQPQIQARACSLDETRSSLEDRTPAKTLKPQRPGAGIRSKTSFRGWASKKGQQSPENKYGAVQEGQHHIRRSREEHRPNTHRVEDLVYVLTLKLTESLEKPMNEMRQLYFPKRLNRTPAHLTLFHALPHSQIEALEQSLKQLSSETKPFGVTTGGPFRMRKGVGVNVDEGYQNMKAVHYQLRTQWLDFLSEQDAGGFKPHWTIMNKADEDEEVDKALRAVREELSQRTKEGQAVGLELWKYDRGNWIWANEYTFGMPAASTSNGAGYLSPTSSNGPSSEQAPGTSNKRPGLMKRGSSVADTWRSMSFLRKS